MTQFSTRFFSLGFLVFFTLLLSDAKKVFREAGNLGPQLALMADSDLVINEILADPDPTNGDANGDGSVSTSQDEFVELVNSGTDPIDISGWTLADATSDRHTFAANTILCPGSAIVVFSGGTPTGDFGAAMVVTAGSLGLNNGGDDIIIKDENDTEITRVSYGSEGGDNQSLTRDPDLTGSLTKHSTATGANGALFSPGTQVDGTAFTSCVVSPTDVVINEFRGQASAPGDGGFFELKGSPGTSLDGLWLLEITTNNSGEVRNAFDLTGRSIDETGYFVAGQQSRFPDEGFDFDLEINSLDFTNANNYTLLLVDNFTGSEGDDLDTDDVDEGMGMGSFEITPWDAIIDMVGVKGSSPNKGLLYSTVTVGPDPNPASNNNLINGLPGAAFRCPDGEGGFVIADYNDLTVDTRKRQNICPGQDAIPPSLFTIIQPQDDAENVDLATNLMVQFDEAILANVGDIEIRKTSDNSLVESIAIGNTTIDGDKLTIDPISDLEELTEFYLLIEAGAVKDADGNEFVGLADTETWSFTTGTICDVFFTESFETDGSTDRYVVTEFSDGSGDFFTRTDGTGITSSYNVSGPDGSFFFAGMDTDAETEGGDVVELLIEDIDITAKENLMFKGLFAEDDDGSSNQDWDDDSRVSVLVQIDGGGFDEILRFEATGGTNTEPAQDTDFSGRGDGTVLTDAFAEFSAMIAGTGTSMDIKIEIANLEAGDEDIAFDNIRVCGKELPACPTDLFFSEYGEGGTGLGDEKYIEIYNGTGSTIDLSTYEIQRVTNGGNFIDDQPVIELSGMLEDGQTLVLHDPDANAAISGSGDLQISSTSISHNGDDAYALVKIDFGIVDLIGDEGADPGSGWDVAGVTNATANGVLVRKSSVLGGNTDWDASRGTTEEDSEWIVLADADWSNVGAHTFDACEVEMEEELPACPTDLFFSEYGEGGTGLGDEKYIEIYNGTGSTIDLSTYEIQRVTNGGNFIDDQPVIELSGMLEDGQTLVLHDPDANAAISGSGDLQISSTSISHNGDDAYALVKIDFGIVDLIGDEGADPGSGWDVAGVTNATANGVLVRKSSVLGGNTDWDASRGTTEEDSEWIVLADADWSNVGAHTFDACEKPIIPDVAPKPLTILPAPGILNGGIPNPAEITIEFSEDIMVGGTNDFVSITLLEAGAILETQTLSSLTNYQNNTLTVDLSQLFAANNLSAADEIQVTLIAAEISDKDGASALLLDGDCDGIGGDDLSFEFIILKPITIPYMEMVENCEDVNNWQAISVDADQENTWFCNGEGAFEVNAFGDNAPAEDWLISPPFNLDATTGEILSFDLLSGFTDIDFPQVEVFYTNTFTGNPTDAGNNWVDISDQVNYPEESSFVFTNSGIIELNDIVGGMIQFAFKYVSSGTGPGNSTAWELDNFFIKEFGAEFNNSEFICIGEPVQVSANFFGGSAPYSVTINGQLFTTNNKQEIFLLDSPSEMPGSTTLAFTNIKDGNGNMVADISNNLTLSDCAIQNDFLAEDPCDCLNDQSTNGAQDGSFSETISVTTTTAGQTWSIKSISGVTGGSGLAPVKKPPVGAAVAITEFLNNTSTANDPREYIELFNYGSETVNLENWVLKDEGSDIVTLPALSLTSGSYVVIVIAGGGDLATAKSDFEADWFGGAAQANVIAVNNDGPNNYALGNSADEIILEDEGGNLIWSLAYPNGESDGRATFLTEVDIASAPMAYGSSIMPGINRDGPDLGTTDFLGYESNNRTTDPNETTAISGDVGSPLAGAYEVLTTKDMPIQMGTQLLYDQANSRHAITFLHFDDSGYEIEIEGPNPMGDPNNTTLKLSNLCAYPEVFFDPDFSAGLPQNAVPFELSFGEVNDFPEDPNQAATFAVNGNPATQFAPFENTPGDYTISGTFKAEFENNVAGKLIDPANPGCITDISEILNVRPTFVTTDSCTCANQVNVILTPDCSFELALNQVTGDDCVGLRVQVNDGINDNGAIIDCPGTFEYGIFDAANTLMCWGTVKAEDKTGPVVTLNEIAIDSFDCSKVEFVLNKETSTKPTRTDFFGNVIEELYYLGRVEFEDNCVDCGCGVTTDFADFVEYYPCDSIIATNTVGRLIRTWTARDCNGIQATERQVFRIYRPALEDVLPIADLTIQTCDASSVTLPAPRPLIWLNELDGTTLSTQLNCSYGFEIEDGPRFSVCDGKGYKFERIYRVIDWCTGESTNVDTVLVKVGDFEAPVFDDCVLTDDDELVDFDGFSLSRPGDILAGLNGNNITPEMISTSPAVCMIDVSTGPMDCTASLNTDLAALRNLFGADLVKDCSDPSITVEVISYGPELNGGFPTGRDTWTIGGYVQQGPMVVGLPLGFHALVISASDDCYNSAMGIVFFKVVDKVKPVMKCDDELRVTLVEGDEKTGVKGYALVSYQDVDEGSWDNCELNKLEVRRDITNAGARADWIAKNGDDDLDEEDDYTPWGDIVEFFCADVDSLVKVELRGTDNGAATGADEDNQSICWLHVNVENGLNFSVTLNDLKNGPITCEEVITAENAGDYADFDVWGMQCGGPEIGLGVIADLDQCGDGVYKIFLEVTGTEETKNAVNIDEDTVIVRVELVHDYWIKFPADVELTCFEVEDYDGVETSAKEDVACDLLAIYTDTPERFDATTGGACYKLFVTYKVINWCEYDGESLPVIVSRDWDNWNGKDCAEIKSANGDVIAPFESNIVGGRLDPGANNPDGDNIPGDEDIYVIVERNLADDKRDVVYYDRDNNPYNNIPDNPDTEDEVEGYWWKVVSGSNNASIEQYYESGFRCVNSSGWGSDGGVGTPEDHSDLAGISAADDDDYRYGSFGYWQYTQHVLVYDDTPPTVTASVDIANEGSINNEDCAAEVTLNINIEDECSVEDLVVQVIDNSTGLPADAPLKGDAITLNADGTASTTFEAGRLEIEQTYKWTVRVNDGCGNITDTPVEFEVVDVKAPAPICHEDLVVELMPTDASGSAGSNADLSEGIASVWADDFIASPIGDCSGQGPELVNFGGQDQLQVTKFSINRLDSTVVETQNGLTLTCADANNVVTVEIHAWDEAGNHDYCVTNILVQDNNNSCDRDVSVGFIAGAISTEEARPVEGVEVRLSGGSSQLYMTKTNGEFGFENIEEGHDYSVTPQKDTEAKNGVSTFDLILIQKHILGAQPLDSPYKLIAADVNNSKSVSTLDLIQLRKLILNIDTEFGNNTSWRFVEADYRFANPSNPWAGGFPEVKNINNLDRADYASFVAVKIGDVNGSALVEARSATGTLAINAAERAMVAGNEYTVTFKADLKDIAGYQFTMNVEHAEIVDIVYGAAKAEHFGVFTRQGVITTSFNGEVLTGNVSSELFSLVIRATADVNLSNALSVSSRYTAAEAYTDTDANGQHKLLDVKLAFTGATAQAAAFALTQNTPNPFQGETVIGFNLPSASEATLRIQDVAGRTVKLIEGDFTKGYNQVNLKSSNFPSAGVYFYTLTAGDLTATKKMILSEVVNRR